MPFGRWMEIAGGVLGWSEAQFWDSSMQFFTASFRGWLEKNGNKKSELAQEDYDDFKREHCAELSMTSDDLARMRAKQKAKEGGSHV